MDMDTSKPGTRDPILQAAIEAVVSSGFQRTALDGDGVDEPSIASEVLDRVTPLIEARERGRIRRATHKASLLDDLRYLLNIHSRENLSNTPDFILAEYLLGCLEAFERATAAREEWYDCRHDPYLARFKARTLEVGELTITSQMTPRRWAAVFQAASKSLGGGKQSEALAGGLRAMAAALRAMAAWDAGVPGTGEE